MPSVIKGDSNVNLDFSTGGRITGDFSNATVANRVMFQTSTVNGATNVGAIPNGTSVQGQFTAWNNSDTTNASNIAIVALGSEVRIQNGITGTGTFLPMTFYTGGSERMRIDTSGNVGIGTSSPNNKLNVVGGISSSGPSGGFVTYRRDTNASAFTIYSPDYSLSFFDNTVGERMRIDSSGNVSIGGTSGNGKLNVITGNVNLTDDYSLTWGTQGAYLNGSTASNYLRFFTNSTERARIDSSGNLLVGTTSSGQVTSGWQAVSYANGWFQRISHTSAAASGDTYISFQYNAGGIGQITQNGTTGVTYGTTSDYRLKENVQPMTGALAKVAALKPVTYKWKTDGSDGQGFIAHELADVCPDAVQGVKDAVDAEGKPVYQGIDTSFLVATLTAAIQEQQALIESLTARIAALEGAQA